MSNYLSDEEIDGMYEEAGIEPAALSASMPAQPMVAAPSGPVAPDATVYPIYPITGMGQAPPAADSLLTRQIGPLPVWGWGLVVAGVGVGGYFIWQNQQKKVASNSDSEGGDAGGGSTGGASEGGWGPSRSTFGDHLRKLFTRKAMADRVAIYTDADEAKKKLKQVSPLVTIKVDGAYKVDKDLEKLCRREGLSAVAHEDGSIGFYPATSKRGREWEEYIDALRDDGQTV